MNKAYVFNVSFNGLGVARALGMNGIDVIGLDSSPFAIGRYSKYIKKFHHVSNPNISEERFIQDLMRIGRNEREKPLLIPTNDVWSIAVSKHKNILNQYFLTYNPDSEIIDRVINKKAFYRIMNENGIRVPVTHQIESYNDLLEIRDRLIYPLVIKPNDRMNTNRNKKETRTYQDNRLITINHFEDFSAYKDIIDRYDFIIQQKITGLSNRMYTIGIYADEKSEVLAVFSGRKVRGYPAEHGDCHAGESLWVQEIIDIARKAIKIIGYTGIAEVEFKKSESDEEHYLIEINPRTWSWVGITPYVGVNLPLIAYEHIINGKKLFREMDKVTKTLWVREIDDRFNCINHYKGVNQMDFPESNEQRLEGLRKYDNIILAEKIEGDTKPYYIYQILKRLVGLKKFLR